jgi:hypothetical protein
LAIEFSKHNVNINMETSMVLSVGNMKVASPVALLLSEPEQEVDVSAIQEATNRTEISDEAAKAMEIVNVKALAGNIKAALVAYGPMPISGLSKHLPIKEGIEELVAYVRIAKAVGSPRIEDREQVSVTDRDGVAMIASVPILLMSADMFPEDINELGL